MSARSEKVTMISLVRDHVERVRHLETQNMRLTRIVHTQDFVNREATGIKDLYVEELATAHRLLEKANKDKAKLEFEVGNLRRELEDLRDKLTVKEQDLSKVENCLMSTESQVHDLQASLNNAVHQHKHCEDKYNKLKKEFDLQTTSLATAKKKLENETKIGVDFANEIVSLKKKLDFNNQVHQQLLEDSEINLKQAMQLVVEKNDEQVCITREVADLRVQVVRIKDATERSQSELGNYRKHIDELMSQNVQYEARIRDLEKQMKQEEDYHRAKVDRLTAKAHSLEVSLEDQLKKNQDLMDVKIQLDMEIAACREFLESDEPRINIKSEEPTPGDYPCCSAGGDSSRKRRRVEETSFGTTSAGLSMIKQAPSSTGYRTTRSAKDVIKIRQIDPDAKFVKIYNSSAEKSVALGEWSLEYFCGDNVTKYKFRRSLHLKPQKDVTIWSSDVEHLQHSRSDNLIMKGQKFFAGDCMEAKLLNRKGEEMASMEMRRFTVRTTIT